MVSPRRLTISGGIGMTTTAYIRMNKLYHVLARIAKNK
jgi:hypothetical protein